MASSFDVMSAGGDKVRLLDVAKAVGCSVATVSNAINGRGRMSEKRRQEILKCCAEQNFVPNSAGRSLRLQRTDVVGVIYAPSFAELFGNVFYARIMEGMAETLGEAGIDLMLGHREGEGGLPGVVQQGKVDALVVLAGVFEPADFEKLKNCPVPICLVDTYVDYLEADSLTSDGIGGGRLVAEYLVEQGHQEVVIVAYDSPIYNIQQRITGFLEGLKSQGIDLPEKRLVCLVKDNKEAVQSILKKMKGKHAPTAVFAINDTMAEELMVGLSEAGVSIPEDLSIVGFDDDPVAARCVPALTTIGMEKRNLGEISATMILNRLQDSEAEPSHHVQPVRLVKRDSVAKR